MDWLNDFAVNFKDCKEIQFLKNDRFHGALEINFCDGIPMNYNFKLHRKATKPERKKNYV